MKIRNTMLIALLLLSAAFAYYLFRPLGNIPDPAAFTCLEIEAGTFLPRDSLPPPRNIYGMGLTYRGHLQETAATFDPAAPPPIFRKAPATICGDGARVPLPTREEMIAAVAALDTAAAGHLRTHFADLAPLLDYEVELGFVLLKSIDPDDLAREDFVPQLGFFLVNDLSARSVGLIGEGTDQRYEFWGISKSFPSFLPVADRVWVPTAPTVNSIPCLRIETQVNDTVRQSQTTDNMIYTPRELLRFIYQKYPDVPLQRGDMVLTGTPGGVAIATSRALVRLSTLLGMDRYRKLSLKLKKGSSAFLQTGDVVTVTGEGLGSVAVEVVQ